MTQTPFTIINYVGNVAASCDFYNRLLECEPAESSPNFALYNLKSGAHLGLWVRSDVAPAVAGSGIGGELAFRLDDQAAVDAAYNRWKAAKAAIAQTPVMMDFGYTFTALDPDGNRLRVFSYPSAQYSDASIP
jgi:catechol 2,3-dioxygenase-like lactoylglutathione lyase family enzyme